MYYLSLLEMGLAISCCQWTWDWGIIHISEDEFGTLAGISAKRNGLKEKHSTKIQGQRSKLDYCQNIGNKRNPIV